MRVDPLGFTTLRLATDLSEIHPESDLRNIFSVDELEEFGLVEKVEEHHDGFIIKETNLNAPSWKGVAVADIGVHHYREEQGIGYETEEEYWERALSKEGLSEDVDANDPDYLIFAFEHLTDQEPLFTKHSTKEVVDTEELKTFTPKLEPISPGRKCNGNYNHGFSHGKRGRKPVLRKHKRVPIHKRHKISKDVREIVMTL